MKYAEEIDWNNVWKKKTDEHNLAMPIDCGSMWQSRDAAKRFWQMASRSSSKRLDKTLAGFELNKSSRVLDIGAGPGNLTIPFSSRFAHVTAVEPAKGMVELLRENCAKQKIDNITVVQKKWEDFEIQNDLKAKCDLVVASFSLGFSDLKQAILKMIKSSSKYICLLWFAGEPDFEKQSRIIWSRLHNTPYIASPKVNILYNTLYQMGIYPEMSVFPMHSEASFSSIQDAVNQFAPRFLIEGNNQEKILYEYFESNLEKINGNYVHKHSSVRVKIWWNKNLLSE